MSTDAMGPDPTTSENDSNQLSLEDTLLDRGVNDLLDEGYSPPDYSPAERFGVTALEEQIGESLQQRESQEQPEVWSPEFHPLIDATRAGRLVDAPVLEEDADGVNQDRFARDIGFDGAVASAEESAVHIITDDDVNYLEDVDYAAQFERDSRPDL